MIGALEKIMSSDMQREELQKTANYLTYTKSLETGWLSCLFLGIVAILMGIVFTILLSWANIGLIVIGFFMAIVGGTAQGTTKAQSLLFIAVGLTAFTIWIIAVPLINLYVGLMQYSFNYFLQISPAIGFFLVFYLIIISINIVNIRSTIGYYRKFHKNPLALTISKQSLDEMNSLIQQIIKTNAGERRGQKTAVTDIMWFKTGYKNSVVTHKAKLTKNYAIFLSIDSKEILFLRPNEFEVISKDMYSPPDRTNVEVRVRGSKSGDYVTSHACLQRYWQWKNSPP